MRCRCSILRQAEAMQVMVGYPLYVERRPRREGSATPSQAVVSWKSPIGLQCRRALGTFDCRRIRGFDPTPAGANAQVPPSFGVCAACHSTDGSTSVGPSLKGVMAARSARSPASRTARAMRTSRGAWDEKSLDTFIAEPQKAIPGNTMPFAGVSDPKQRAEIVDYLKTLQ